MNPTNRKTAPAPDASPSPVDADQVVGDRISVILRRWRPFVLATALLLVVALVGLMVSPQQSAVPFAIDNPGARGTQALARILRDEGVTISTVRSTAEAEQAALEGATVALVNAGRLTEAQRERLAATGADVVVVGGIYQDLGGLTGLTPSGSSAPSETLLTPDCTDADAVAAASLAGTGGSVTLAGTPGARGCFPLPQQNGFAYATAPLSGGGTVRVLADPGIVTNARLAKKGNAALSMRALGHHDRLVWFDADRQEPPSMWETVSVPPWFPFLAVQAGFVVAALAVVRGRRFGRIVVEDLPVTVRATETTRGRGRLYRHAVAREQASEALRTATAIRLAHALGMPSGSERADVARTASRTTRWPPQLVDEVLRGPVPPTDRALADLAVQLDRLESEVLAR